MSSQYTQQKNSYQNQTIYVWFKNQLANILKIGLGTKAISDIDTDDGISLA